MTAVRDALAQLEPPVDEIILATHPQQKSGWLRKNVVDRIRESAGSVPVEHVVVDMTAETGAKNVLVLANETVVGQALARPNPRARCPRQCELPDHLAAERPDAGRAPGGGAPAQDEPWPSCAAKGSTRTARSPIRTRSRLRWMRFSEERVDEIIVSTFAPSRSPWLRKNLVQRLHNETKLPVEHIVFQPDQVEEGAPA